MLPLHSKDTGYKSGRFRFKDKFLGWIRLILSDKTSRNLFLFLLLNLSFAFIELIYGFWTNSLGLISDSFHMFFDCTALLAGLAASVIMKWRSNDKFSYGYVRAEVIAGFVNGLFLLFIAFFIFSEAVERAIEPPEVKHERLFLVSVAGFIVNLIGIFAFQHGHSHGGGGGHGHSHSSKSDHGHSHSITEKMALNHHDHDHDHHEDDHDHSHGGHGHSHNSHGHSHGGKEKHSHEHSHSLSGGRSQIMQGVFLHILADTLGSVGVIISAILMSQFGWMIADPICSLFIATMIGLSTIPLLRDAIYILMQRTPRELEHLLPGCYQRVMQLEGVLGVQDPHFWTLCSEVYIGTIKLEVAPTADSKYILSHTHSIFTQVGVRQLYVQIDCVPM